MNSEFVLQGHIFGLKPPPQHFQRERKNSLERQIIKSEGNKKIRESRNQVQRLCKYKRRRVCRWMVGGLEGWVIFGACLQVYMF